MTDQLVTPYLRARNAIGFLRSCIRSGEALTPKDEAWLDETLDVLRGALTLDALPSVEPDPDDESLVEPPDPVIWQGAARCDVCGHIETHADHAAQATEVERLRELLARNEWVQPMSNSSPSCPQCGAMQHWGHEPSCALRTALVREGEKP